MRVNVAITESMEGDEGRRDKDRSVQTCGKGHVKVIKENIMMTIFFGHVLFHDNLNN